MLNIVLTDSRRPLRADIRRKSGREVLLAAIDRQLYLLGQNFDGYQRAPRVWWWRAEDGSYLVELRYSSVLLELEAGKPSILAGSTKADVERVLRELGDAVRRGDLDAVIDAARARIAGKR